MSLNEKQKEEIRKELEKEMDRYAGGCANCNAGFYITERNALDVAIKFLNTHTTKAVEEKVEEIKGEIEKYKGTLTMKWEVDKQKSWAIDYILTLPSLINNKQGNE